MVLNNWTNNLFYKEMRLNSNQLIKYMRKLEKEDLKMQILFLKKTGIDVEDIKSVISHVFLEKHDIPAQGGFIMKHDYLTPNDEIAYAWRYTKETKNELTDNQKEWFKKWVTHEKQESEAMSEEGLPLRKIESWNGETYTGDPPGAHDKALKQKLEFDGYTSWFAKEIMRQ